MDQALTRADDRALFGLLPVPSEAGTRPQNTAPD